MDAAQCILDDEIYQAVQFAGLPPSELSRKRRSLVCSECGALAYFRKASHSGQAACFGARPHQDGCSLAASASEQNDNGLGDDQDQLVNPGQRIVIDFNFGEQQSIKHNDPDAVANVGGRGGRFTGDGIRPNAAMHRRLGTILKNLITSEQFRNSRQILEIEGKGEFMVADFFVPFHAVALGHVGQYHGYWGKIANARVAQGALWLNSGGRDNVSIRVPEESIEELFQRFGINNEAELAGANTLIFGTLRNSYNNNKKHVPVTDLGYITVHLA